MDTKEFDLFTRLQFRIFYDKEVITGDNPINVKLLATDYTPEAAYNLSKKISEFFGLDDGGICAKAGADYFNANEYDLFWTIGNGESFISIERNEKEGFTLNILFYNNLIKHNVGDLLKPSEQ